MLDWYVLLAPLLLLPLVALVRFIGCQLVFGLDYVPQPLIVMPPTADLKAGQTQQFSVEGQESVTDLAWTLTSSSSTPGSITPEGLYTAPSAVAVAFAEQVTATAKGRSEGTATVSLTPGNSATFVRFDDLTQGSWHGVYGADGFALAHLPQPDLSLPAYSTSFPIPPQTFLFQDPSALLKSLENPANTGRYTYVWFDVNGFNFAFNFTDAQTHQVAIYCVDFDTQGREQTLTAFDGDTSAMLGTPQSIVGFQNGTYLVYSISGRVRLEVTHTKADGTPGGGQNAVVSGVFFR